MKNRLITSSILFIVAGIAGLVWIFGPLGSTHSRHDEAAAQYLRNAIKQFHLQYSVYPLIPATGGQGDHSTETNKPFVDTLLGTSPVTNPRGIAFGEWREADKDGRRGIVVKLVGPATLFPRLLEP